MQVTIMLSLYSLIALLVVIAIQVVYADAAMIVLDQSKTREDRLKQLIPHFAGIALVYTGSVWLAGGTK